MDILVVVGISIILFAIITNVTNVKNKVLVFVVIVLGAYLTYKYTNLKDYIA